MLAFPSRSSPAVRVLLGIRQFAEITHPAVHSDIRAALSAVSDLFGNVQDGRQGQHQQVPRSAHALSLTTCIIRGWREIAARVTWRDPHGDDVGPGELDVISRARCDAASALLQTSAPAR